MAEITLGVGGGIPVRTSAYISRFEHARLVGLVTLRMLCSNCGYVGFGENEHMMQLAEEAILRRQIDAVIRRPLPDGSFEDCALKSLLIL
jgi:DNA-directed RNA polymerase I, II, and III subunit RPABC2